MTNEERREYMRSWRANHKEQIRESKRNCAIRRAIDDIKAGKVVLVERTTFAERQED